MSGLFPQATQPQYAEWQQGDQGGLPPLDQDFGGNGFQEQGFQDEYDVAAELDALLSGDDLTPPAPQGQQGQQGQQGNANADTFRQYIEEQRAERTLTEQRLELERQRLNMTVEEQRRQQEAQQRQEEIKNRVARFAPKIPERHVPQEMVDAYKGADPYIQSVVEKALKEQWEQTYAPAFSHYEEQIETLRNTKPTPATMSMDDRIAIMRPEVNQLVREAGFNAFLAEPVEGTGMTRKELLNIAYERNNVNAVLQHLDAYKAASASARPNRRVAPNSGVHSAPTGRQAQARMVAYSQLNEAQAKYRQGMISQERLMAIESRFEDLAARGLVDYNK